MSSPFPTIHATAVLLGDEGVLIRGPSGSGKTSTALALIDRMRSMMRFAALVADDRVLLESRGGRLIARTPQPIAGLVECRGLGILPIDHEDAAVVRLVIDLMHKQAVPRLPEVHERSARLLGVTLPRLAVAPDAALVPLVFMALQAARTLDCDTGKTCVCAAT